MRSAQVRILNNLLSTARLTRMVELSAIDGTAAYQPVDFLTDVRRGVWSELGAASVRIDPYRRNLQRAWLDLVSARISPTPDEVRALFRGELKALDAELRAAPPKPAMPPRAATWTMPGRRLRWPSTRAGRRLDVAPAPARPGQPGDARELEGDGPCWPIDPDRVR